MKILVLQLARLGDIYLSHPALRALKRRYPQAEIHFLVRDRFKAAAQSLEVVDRLWIWDTKKFLAPFIYETPDKDEAALKEVSSFCESLRNEKFTNIINLSFSPLSSYLTHAIAGSQTQVMGYTRFEDGYLNLPDDTSAYFYAQVGVGRYNRLHLSDIFATTMGLEMEEADFVAPVKWLSESNKRRVFEKYNLNSFVNQDFLVVHIGSSTPRKTLEVYKWRQVVHRLVKEVAIPVVLVGGKEEEENAQQILVGLKTNERICSLVGRTELEEVFPILEKSRLVIGGDSVMVHMASLVQTPVLNLSFSSVRFWETGPTSPGSRVLYTESSKDLASDRVILEVLNCLDNVPSRYKEVYYRQMDILSPYKGEKASGEFQWSLIKAIYMGKMFPVVENALTFEGLKRLAEIVILAKELLQRMGSREQRAEAQKIFDLVDDLLFQVMELAPELYPLVSWFQTERVRIGPGSFETILEKTKKCFFNLEKVLSLYLDENELKGDSSGKNMFR